jgi:predicted TIM-barrel fold metal-dependent hydrolase
MIIDMHCHIAPPKWAETKPLPRSLIQIADFFRQKEQAGVTLSVISNPMMNIPGTQQNDLEFDKIREYEDFVLEISEKYPGRVVSFLGVNPLGERKILYEVERAVTQLGFKGVMVNSSVDGVYLDASNAAEFWELAGKLGIPVFVHPPALPPSSKEVQDFRLVENVTRWNDITLGLSAVIFAGILEKYPALSLIGAMGGGGLAMLKDRLDVGYRHKELIPKSIAQPLDYLSDRPSASLKQIYVDTCTYGSATIMWNIATFGVDHLVFGSDMPPFPISTTAAIQAIKDLPIDDEEKEKILWKNAAKLLKLEEACATGLSESETC